MSLAISEDRACPNCDARLQFHSLTAWCLHCGWSKNLNGASVSAVVMKERHRLERTESVPLGKQGAETP